MYLSYLTLVQRLTVYEIQGVKINLFLIFLRSIIKKINTPLRHTSNSLTYLKFSP